MATGILKKIGKVIKKLKPKPKFSKKNVGLNRIKSEKLYNTVGKDKYGDIKITNKGPQVGYRVPLDKKKFTERRPWAQDPDYKKSAGERVYSAHAGSRTKKAAGGIAQRGLGRAFRRGGKV